MKAAIYCRVSTEDQEREGTSLDSQLEACRKKAQELGYEVVENLVVMETYSGLSLDRPKLNQIRQWVRDREVDIVISYTLDRLSRDPVHFIILQEEFEKAGVEAILVTEDIDSSDLGRLITYIKGYAAKLEAEKIKERTIRGKRERAKSGRLLGGKSSRLYGYNYLSGKGVGEGVRYLNEEQAKWVREIYRWLVEEGLPVNGIVYRLRTLGVATPSGDGFWGKCTVHKILRNPAYIGKTYAFTQSRVEAKKHVKADRKSKATHIIFKPREEWLEIPGATPPIISEETYQRAQLRLQRNKEIASRNTKYHYLLQGYIFCKLCGRRYSGMTVPDSNKHGVRRRYYYRCPKGIRIVSAIRCPNRTWNGELLDGLVWGKIKKLLAKPEVIVAELKRRKNEVATVQSFEKEIVAIEKKLHHMEREKDRVWKAFELTGDEPRFQNEIRGIDETVGQLQRCRLELERHIELSIQTEVNMDGIERFCELARRNITHFIFEDKRLALEALNIKVWVNGEHITVEGAIPIVEGEIASATSWRSKQHYHH